MRNLGGTLLERNVGNNFGERFTIRHVAIFRLDPTALFEQGSDQCTTDVHPVAHHHGATILLPRPLVVPLANQMTLERTF
jgi:hypothetical protein